MKKYCYLMFPKEHEKFMKELKHFHELMSVSIFLLTIFSHITVFDENRYLCVLFCRIAAEISRTYLYIVLMNRLSLWVFKIMAIVS